MRILSLLVLSWFAFSDAAAAPALAVELAQAKSQWESQRIEDYSFVISNACACPNPVHTGPMQITVREGKLRRAVYLGQRKEGYAPGQAVRRRTPLRVSISGLFETIEKRLKSGDSGHFKIKYDDKLGYPLKFEYDDPALKGEESKIELKDFRRLN